MDDCVASSSLTASCVRTTTGVVVGAFASNQHAIVHTRRYGRAIVQPNAYKPDMKLGTWWKVDLVPNPHSRPGFRWSYTCPYAVLKDSAEPTEDVLPTTVIVNQNGASYVMTQSPLLVGARNGRMCIMYSPVLGRCSTNVAISPEIGKLGLGTLLTGRLASIGSDEEKNGGCTWGLRAVDHGTEASPSQFENDVQQIYCEYDRFVDGVCVLRAINFQPANTFVCFGLCDYKDPGLNEEKVKLIKYFTAWTGPLAPLGHKPTRAFYVEPMSCDIVSQMQLVKAEAVDAMAANHNQASSVENFQNADQCLCVRLLRKIVDNDEVKKVLTDSDSQVAADIEAFLEKFVS